MLIRLDQWADRVVRFASYASLILYPGLVFVTIYEVAARYAFNRPTIWSFDVIFMLHGSLFMLTGGYALQKKSHVRIDILSIRLPDRVQHAANLLAYAFLFLPAIWLLAEATIRRSYSAFLTGELELVSAWGPIVWPFFSTLALGLVLLWVQAFVEAVRHLIGMVRGNPMSVPEESG
ncbi:MAG: TRAP transporter small permease subunit [Candidatus Tectomicrobia bacterium]|nr:TRAP transporter small permease subunit [Candidatus Tectomicrobia bacterium]